MHEAVCKFTIITEELKAQISVKNTKTMSLARSNPIRAKIIIVRYIIDKLNI
jgi:hypothetical protein